MSKTTMAEKLYEIPGFQRIYGKLLLNSVRNQFIILRQSELEIDWNYMLLCGSIFATSDKGKYLDAALRIAQFCLVRKDVEEHQKAAAAVILDTLTNSPAIKLAIHRNYLKSNYEEHIPVPLQLGRVNRQMKYSILNQEKESIQLINKFQWDVYNSANDNKWVSISAPTSAGKSFILLRLIEEQFFSKRNCIGIYVVPTRALIQQVELDIVESFSNSGLTQVYISSIPTLSEKWKENAQLYILTQERLLWILDEEPDFVPDIVIVDEAQKVGDNSRGVLLQQSVEELVRRSNGTRFLFSSPLTDNPEIFLSDAPLDTSSQPITSEYVAVNQNLLWVNQIKRKPLEWEVSLCVNDDTYNLGQFKISSRPSHESSRLPLVAHALADKSGGNLLYANGASDAEKMAIQLWSLQGEENETSDKEVLDLIELSSNSINKKYSLNVALTRGVGFHYGNMPLLIKNEIERLFKNGKLKFLVCTSTLIEGVNLPAKSIFIRGPKKGKGKPMGEIDFWNLAGRAGRQGKEFQGNVICVDTDIKRVWTKPPRNRMKYTIRKAVDQIVYDNSADFLKYITSIEKERVNTKPEYEYGLTYFLTEYIKKGSISHLEPKYEFVFLDEIESIIKGILSEITLPHKIITRNPGINPLDMQNLLNYFYNYSGDPIELIPSLPEDEHALDNYCRVIDIISEYLSGDVPQVTFSHALLVLNWLRGMSLSRIIERNWNYWSTRGKKLDTVIRDTMRELEEYARFKFLKFSSCYTDLLEYYFIETGNLELAAQVPQLKIWLEFGASQKTQISLMGLGLSRTSSVALSEYITNDSLDKEGCINWLSKIDIDSFGLSPIVVGEIKKALKTNELLI